MEETQSVGKRQEESQPPRGLARRRGRKHPFELRLKAVKLRLEEGFPPELIARELGIGTSTLAEWVRRYRQSGEQGLKPAVTGGRGRAKLAAAVKAQITELKQQHPRFGVKKIAQILRRVLFLPGSHETVRRTLHQQQLIERRRKKPRRNPPKPRFFERSTPNQMWQTDIFTFRLGGKNAYLIGFIDDHSRYIVGLDLFRSQTAEHVLEVYRTAVAEYGLPKEMLTDNGRQYTAWRGKTRFEQELQKDRVHHFRSQPHHPMTLGKIERYWKTIWEDFLVRAQFDSFEQARERIRLWVKYYNHKRPHQSLDGLCPADRFFAIAKELRAVIERGIADNVQELALRGQPQAPFYMVGRLGQQSVVIRAEKGQVKMQLDDEDNAVSSQELTYDIHQPTGEPHDDRNQTQKGTESVQCPSASAGGAGGVDGTAAAGGGLPAVRDQQHLAGAVAAAGDGRDGRGAATALSERTTTGAGVDHETGAAAGAPGVNGRGQTLQVGEAPGQTAPGADGDTAQREVTPARAALEEHEPETSVESAGGTGLATGGADRAGAVRSDHGQGSGPAIGHLPQELLPVGEAGADGAGGGGARSDGRSPVDPPRPGEGDARTTNPGVAGASAGAGAGAGDSPADCGTGTP